MIHLSLSFILKDSKDKIPPLVQKVYGLKLCHSYNVRALSPVEPPKGPSDILKTKFEFQTKVDGLDHIFERIFCRCVIIQHISGKFC